MPKAIRSYLCKPIWDYQDETKTEKRTFTDPNSNQYQRNIEKPPENYNTEYYEWNTSYKLVANTNYFL